MLDLCTTDYLSRQYQEDRLREAGAWPQARRAPRRLRQHRLLYRLLARLGSLLVVWGQRLQQRCEGPALAPARPAVSPTP